MTLRSIVQLCIASALTTMPSFLSSYRCRIYRVHNTKWTLLYYLGKKTKLSSLRWVFHWIQKLLSFSGNIKRCEEISKFQKFLGTGCLKYNKERKNHLSLKQKKFNIWLFLSLKSLRSKYFPEEIVRYNVITCLFLIKSSYKVILITFYLRGFLLSILYIRHPA
jgi:hypothetical protein